MMAKTGEVTETMANGYSSESTQRELSNKYQHDRVKIMSIIFCFLVHWTKVTSAAEGVGLCGSELRNKLVRVFD